MWQSVPEHGRQGTTEMSAAIDGGILKTAEENGRATLSGLLQGLGFETVLIR